MAFILLSPAPALRLRQSGRLGALCAGAIRSLSCPVRTRGGGTRHDEAVGTGAFTIAQLGGGRVETFVPLPAITQRQAFNRVFVERGGQVYFGYRSGEAISRATRRLNPQAANAVLAMPGPAPIVPQAAFVASHPPPC